jgi:hypothetical protein
MGCAPDHEPSGAMKIFIVLASRGRSKYMQATFGRRKRKMNDHRLQVMQAESALQAAKAAVRADEQCTGKQALADVRNQLRQAHATYNRLRRAIRNGQAGVQRAQAEVELASAYISENLQLRPAVAEFLPDDPEVRAWQQQHNELLAQRDRAIARHDAMQATIPNIAEAARYEGNFGVIAELERAQNNLVRKLRGEPIGAGWQGGVYRVL